MTEPTAHRVTWFVPDRPVEGATVYVRPAPDQPEPTTEENPMASDAKAVRKDLVQRGYQVDMPTRRGATSYDVRDPKTGLLVARFPVNPSQGSWRANLDAAIRRYERTGTPARSNRVRFA